jgi:hypothetical protein
MKAELILCLFLVPIFLYAIFAGQNDRKAIQLAIDKALSE